MWELPGCHGVSLEMGLVCGTASACHLGLWVRAIGQGEMHGECLWVFPFSPMVSTSDGSWAIANGVCVFEGGVRP